MENFEKEVYVLKCEIDNYINSVAKRKGFQREGSDGTLTICITASPSNGWSLFCTVRIISPTIYDDYAPHEWSGESLLQTFEYARVEIEKAICNGWHRLGREEMEEE